MYLLSQRWYRRHPMNPTLTVTFLPGRDLPQVRSSSSSDETKPPDGEQNYNYINDEYNDVINTVAMNISSVYYYPHHA